MTAVEMNGKATSVRAPLLGLVAMVFGLCGIIGAQSFLIDRQHAELLKSVDDKAYGFAAGFLDACGYPCVIRENRGGSLHDFEMLAALVRVRKTLIIIDGPCISACALFADMARQYVQITKSASFHFHKTSVEEDPPQSPDIARWVNAHGGFPAFISNCLTQMPFEEARRFWRPFFDWYAIPRKIDPLPPFNPMDPLGLARKAPLHFDTVAGLPPIILRGSVQ